MEIVGVVRLRAKQERFCQILAFGDNALRHQAGYRDGKAVTQTDAYMLAFGTGDVHYASTAAAKLVRRPEIAARIAELTQRKVEMVEAKFEHALTTTIGRVEARCALHDELMSIKEQRGEAYQRSVSLGDPSEQQIAEMGDEVETTGIEPASAGCETGLLCRTYKNVAGVKVEEWSIDGGLVDRLEGIKDSIAEELGQKVKKAQIEITPKAVIGVNLDDI